MVKKVQDYLINFSILNEGLHAFDFEAGDSFFEDFGNPDIAGGNIKVHINFHKSNTCLEIDFYISGALKIACDRCLEVFSAEVDTIEKVFIRFGNEYNELEDNVLTIPHEETKIDVSRFIYEYAILCLPIKKVHPDATDGKPGCVEDMLRILDEYSGKKKKQPDPVWERLKDIVN